MPCAITRRDVKVILDATKIRDVMTRLDKSTKALIELGGPIFRPLYKLTLLDNFRVYGENIRRPLLAVEHPSEKVVYYCNPNGASHHACKKRGALASRTRLALTLDAKEVHI